MDSLYGGANPDARSLQDFGRSRRSDAPADPAWATRARRAHANAVENLAVFAPMVVILALMGASTPATVTAAKIFLGARLLHYIVYAAGIPVVRTLAFAAGFAATLVIAQAVLGRL
ncbi:MAG TPA: MAPEG family protein [Rhizomicrobium sp.]|nr:MAPEG family protein [Rhizomicrobium sp.]